MDEAATRQRIDKWLFFARIVKSRSLAQKLVRDGHVRLNGSRVIRPRVDVGDGDKLVVALERRDVHVIVRAAGTRRGPFAEAQTLYEDISPPPGVLPTTGGKVARSKGRSRLPLRTPINLCRIREPRIVAF